MPKVPPIVRVAAVLVGGLVLALLVLAVTMDRIAARAAPRTALAWNPGSADANARLGSTLLTQASPATAGRLRALGERALARQPVNATGAMLLGVAASLSGDERRAERLIRYAETMSRRDTPTQMWLIERSVSRNDVASALVHYDRALRTSSGVRDILFPILNQAVADPEIARPFVGYLARRPIWEPSFMTQYIPVAKTPSTLFAFARALHLDRPPVADPTMLQAVEKRLVDLGDYARAAALYNRAHGRAEDDRAALRNGGFEQPGNWDPFDWNLIDDENLAGLRQPRPGRGGGTALFPFAANGRSGDVAVQLTRLLPGSYAIDATVGATGADPLAFPQLIVRCAADGREFLNTRFPAAPEGGRPWRNRFAVPADCPAQRIVVRATSALDGKPAAPWIDDINIRPLGSR